MAVPRRRVGRCPGRGYFTVDRADDLWERIEPLLPKKERRFRYPGRLPVPDRQVLCGILYVLRTDIQWEHLPKELGFGSGMTCWRRLRDWNEAGVWQRLHETLLAELNAAARLDWSRCVVDSSHVRVLKLMPLLDAIPPIRGRVGHPCRKPDSLFADRGYDHDIYRNQVRARGPRHRPQKHPPRHRTRCLPLGGRADLRLAPRLPTTPRSLGTPSRHSRSLP